MTHMNEHDQQARSHGSWKRCTGGCQRPWNGKCPTCIQRDLVAAIPKKTDHFMAWVRSVRDRLAAGKHYHPTH